MSFIGKPAEAAAPEMYDFVFDTGQRIRAGRAGLLGRNPASPDAATICSNVDDPDLSISKNHLEYGIDDQGLWVKDRRSTNGSTLQHPGGTVAPLKPGQKTPAGVGDLVTIGQRSFRIEKVGE